MNVKISQQQEQKNVAATLKLERFAPYRLSILSNRISDIIAAAYRDRFALSVTEWRIVAVLGENDGISGEQVSVKTQIEKSILSRAIKKLLNRQIVERSFDSNDRRRQALKLSTLGKDIYSQVVPLSLDYEKKLLTCFSEQERQQFSAYIDRLYAHTETVS